MEEDEIEVPTPEDWADLEEMVAPEDIEAALEMYGGDLAAAYTHLVHSF